MSWELAKEISALSRDLRRQLGLVVNRKGSILSIVVGTRESIPIPKEVQERVGVTRLSRTRFIHTHLNQEGFSPQDFTALATRRFDVLGSLQVNESGFPENIFIAHIAPENPDQVLIKQLPPTPFLELDLDIEAFVASLEEEIRRNARAASTIPPENRAILCSMSRKGDSHLGDQIHETKDLAHTAGVEILETFIQNREAPHPKTMLGSGKIQEIALRAAQLDADLLIFQQNLTPNQARHISEMANLRVIDRTQVILDIFAQRAKSHDGKLQVELAQLKYSLPRMREWDTQMSRLVGGIGGRGPGETKLEIHRRRARERINRLEKEIHKIAQKRSQKRGLRERKKLPIVSIVGYTNAGKSTLLNTLTHANARAENKLFATLDPYSKRLRFPRDREVILTDTVGFIRDLPPDLQLAFRATLEEIGNADLLLHVVDASYPHYQDQIDVVQNILRDLGVSEIPQILVLNKTDLLPGNQGTHMARLNDGFSISALKSETCRDLLEEMEQFFDRGLSKQLNVGTG